MLKKEIMAHEYFQTGNNKIQCKGNVFLTFWYYLKVLF